jgi:hypothetical protein
MAPGEFTVISARALNQLLGGRKSLVGRQLTPTILSERAALSVTNMDLLGPSWPFDPEHCPECRPLSLKSTFRSRGIGTGATTRIHTEGGRILS